MCLGDFLCFCILPASEKVSLERYRLFSQRILNIYTQYSALIERASVDEAYIDLTEAVERRLLTVRGQQQPLAPLSWSGTAGGQGGS